MPATVNHASFKQPNDPGVSLWRYMDLSKFAALLQKGSLTFPRCDRLGDPFEGSLPEPNARYWETVKAMKASGVENPFSSMSDGLIDRMGAGMREGRVGMLTTSYVSCWHMNEGESAAMWKLYSKSSDAVCIRTNYATLAATLPAQCFLGVVRYIDFKTDQIDVGNLLNTLMVKRRSFAHEREARAVMWDGEAIGKDEDTPVIKDVPIDLSTLLKGIYVSPEAPDWFRDVVSGLATTYGLTIPVEHSEMNAAPLY